MDLNWYENPLDLLAHSKTAFGVVLSEVYSGPYPYLASAGAAPQLINALIYKVAIGTDTYSVLILCKIEEGLVKWAINCGDPQTNGDVTGQGKQLAVDLKEQVSSKVTQQLLASAWEGTVDFDPCGFLSMLKRTGRYCTHTAHVLGTVKASQLQKMASDLQLWFAGEEEESESLFPEEAAFYDSAFIQHVLLAGERGSGKTFLARQAAKKFEAEYLEMQMHPSMEAWEFRAHDRAWNGAIYTVLGKLAEAVHLIQQGKRVILVLDEFLNMNPVYTSVINSPLSLTERDTYIIETGKIIDQGDGIGTLETVEVPANMLWIVATSNIGARYNLDQIAPSVRSRFQIILMNTDSKRTEAIVEQLLLQYKMPSELAPRFEKFISAGLQMTKQNLLDEEVTTRLVASCLRAISLRAQRNKQTIDSIGSCLPLIRKQLLREATQVVNFERGALDQDQLSAYTRLVEDSFKSK